MEQTANALPPVTLGQYKGLPVTRRVRPVTEAAVASELKSLARRHAPFCATSAPAARGMRVTLDFEGFLDGAPIPDSRMEQVTVTLGTAQLMPAAEQAVYGHCAGETFRFDFTYPDEFRVPELSGKTAQFEICLHTVEQKQEPTVDDALAQRLAQVLGGTATRCGVDCPLRDWIREAFSRYEGLVFVGAVGIAVRAIAPYVQSKTTDPAVVVVDEGGRFVIPLLSGHIGGANALAERMAEKLGATAVVTTATDVRGKFAVDAWAARHSCAISDMGLAKAVSAAILEGDVPLCSQFYLPVPLPEGTFAGETGPLGIFIGWHVRTPFARTLRLIPRVLRVGVGCRRGISAEAGVRAVQTVFAENGLDTAAIRGVCSIDLKQDEPGLLAACEKNNWPVHFYTAQQLRDVAGDFTPSDFVRSVTGVDNVCERAALLDAEKLIVQKTARDGVTVAVAAEHWEVRFG